MGGALGNTVFNPTTNGSLHLGHIYMMLVNQHEAHAHGGKFLVRFDDTQAYWNDRMSYVQQTSVKQTIVQDVEYMGIAVDEWHSQSMMQQEAHSRLTAMCHRAGIPVPAGCYVAGHLPEVPRDPFLHYPFTPFITAEKAVMDDMNSVSLKIRGEDLLGEFSLYSYFREAFGMYQPRQVFLPRLRFSMDGDTGDISKTDANMQVQDLRRRAGPYGSGPILLALAKACLIDPHGPWALDNLTPLPVLQLGRDTDVKE